MKLKLAPVDMKAALEEIKHIFSIKALEKGLEYQFELDDNLPPALMLDELRLKQILLNLVDNAVKFTEEGSINVSASLMEVSSDGNRATVSIVVQDTGIGIPDYLHDMVFESFRQQEDHDKKKYKGTGLGLAITKRLVELLNGEIHLESEPGKGSKFEVILKDIEISEKVAPQKVPDFGNAASEKAVLKGEVILVVDEQEANRKLISEALHDTKAIILESETVECINTKLKNPVSLIILELKGKDKDKDILDFIHQHKVLKQAGIIGITSNPKLNDEYKGSKDYIAVMTKPIHLQELVQVVKNHFIPMEEPNLGEFNMADFHKMDEEKLKEVASVLEGDLSDQWRSVLKTSSFKEVEGFAMSLKETGKKYDLGVLASYSDTLVMHARNFDIDNMKEMLYSYSVIINEIRKLLTEEHNGR